MATTLWVPRNGIFQYTSAHTMSCGHGLRPKIVIKTGRWKIKNQLFLVRLGGATAQSIINCWSSSCNCRPITAQDHRSKLKQIKVPVIVTFQRAAKFILRIWLISWVSDEQQSCHAQETLANITPAKSNHEYWQAGRCDQILPAITTETNTYRPVNKYMVSRSGQGKKPHYTAPMINKYLSFTMHFTSCVSITVFLLQN